MENLFNEVLELSEQIRYIALYNNGILTMQQRGAIDNASSQESDKYEELLVNPTLIKLASQRGNIDCRGLEYFVIRYGNFFVLLTPLKAGHINLGIESNKDPLSLVESLRVLLKNYELL